VDWCGNRSLLVRIASWKEIPNFFHHEMSVLEIFDDQVASNRTSEVSLDAKDLIPARIRAPSGSITKVQAQYVPSGETLSSKVVDVNLSNRFQDKASSPFSSVHIHRKFYSEMDKAHAIAKANSNRLRDIVRSANMNCASEHSPPRHRHDQYKERSLRESVERFDEQTRGEELSVKPPKGLERSADSTVYNETMHRRNTLSGIERPREKTCLIELSAPSDKAAHETDKLQAP
jgi:hypothetical protein